MQVETKYYYWIFLFVIMVIFGMNHGIFGILLVAFVGGLIYAVSLDATSKPGDKKGYLSAALDIFKADPTAKIDVSKALVPKKEEVYYVSDNKFTAEEAPAVCAAFGGRIANYGDLEEAYESGANWCGYGWSDDGMALFPIQPGIWEREYSKDPKHQCGRPGINGGFLDPKLKLGVNCYGVKPKMTPGEAQQLNPPAPKRDTAFDNLVNKIKGELSSLTLSPFTEKKWSEYNGGDKSLLKPNMTSEQTWASQVYTDIDNIATKVGGVFK